MPYARCPSCGLTSYCVREDDCPRCGARIVARAIEPAPGGEPLGPVLSALAVACRELKVNAALVSEIADGRENVRWAVGDGTMPAVRPGGSVPLHDTVCQRLLDGRIGAVVADLEREPELDQLPVPRAIGIRAYIGVPFTAADARLYVLCCLAREARPDLSDADVRFLRGIAEGLRDAVSASAAG
jgi:GAF domain-containing protein